MTTCSSLPPLPLPSLPLLKLKFHIILYSLFCAFHAMENYVRWRVKNAFLFLELYEKKVNQPLHVRPATHYQVDLTTGTPNQVYLIVCAHQVSGRPHRRTFSAVPVRSTWRL
jgi:hypothetical protein